MPANELRCTDTVLDTEINISIEDNNMSKILQQQNDCSERYENRTAKKIFVK